MSWEDWAYYLLPDGIHVPYITAVFHLLSLGCSTERRPQFQPLLEAVPFRIKDMAWNGFRY